MEMQARKMKFISLQEGITKDGARTFLSFSSGISDVNIRTGTEN
jgi:hypothetical protein